MMPIETQKVSTTDPDAAFRALNDIYAPERPMSFSKSPQRAPQFEMTANQIDGIHTARIRHTLSTRCLTPPFEGVVGAGILLSGRMQWTRGNEQLRFSAGTVGRFPMTEGWEADASGMDCAVLRVPLASVERVAEQYAGISSAQLRFDGMSPVSEAAAVQWRDLTAYVHRTMGGAGDQWENPLVLAQLVDLVCATALAVFPNTSLSISQSTAPGEVAPAALRRAVAYIEENADQAMNLSDIAGAAGTTGRAVQSAFRRHYDTTPMAYLRQVRLERAHRDLQAADPTAGATVAGIASRWGFTKAARFTEFYRQSFGVSPSRTLRT